MNMNKCDNSKIHTSNNIYIYIYIYINNIYIYIYIIPV